MKFLKEALTEETYAALSKELDGKGIKLANLATGNYVDKAKYETSVKDVQSYKEQLAQRDTDLEELKKTAGLSKEQETQLGELQAKYDADKEVWEQKLKDNQFDSAVDVAIARSGTKDVVALKAHTLAKAKEMEFKDGEIIGYTEYLKEQLSDPLKHLSGEVKASGGNLDNPPSNKTEQDIVNEGMGL